jgi:hypothetical protein
MENDCAVRGVKIKKRHQAGQQSEEQERWKMAVESLFKLTGVL